MKWKKWEITSTQNQIYCDTLKDITVYQIYKTFQVHENVPYENKIMPKQFALHVEIFMLNRTFLADELGVNHFSVDFVAYA